MNIENTTLICLHHFCILLEFCSLNVSRPIPVRDRHYAFSVRSSGSDHLFIFQYRRVEIWTHWLKLTKLASKVSRRTLSNFQSSIHFNFTVRVSRYSIRKDMAPTAMIVVVIYQGNILKLPKKSSVVFCINKPNVICFVDI